MVICYTLYHMDGLVIVALKQQLLELKSTNATTLNVACKMINLIW
jgi:hypothetical protein